MLRLHINNWVCLRLLALVLAWAGNSLIAQDSGDLLSILSLDAEDPLPEEDILLLEDILKDSNGLSRNTIKQIAHLSFVTESDLEQIRKLSKTNTTSFTKNNYGLTPITKHLLEILLTTERPYLPISLSQMHTFHNDVRYRWRARVVWPEVVMGLNMERDPGELSIVDYLSGYVAGRSGAYDWIIGDHQILYGYGLHLWRSTAGFKGFDSGGTAHRRGRGIQPYRASNEAWGLRGLALQKHKNQSNLIFSISNNFRDGIIDSTGFPAINSTGLHLSEKSLQERGALRELVLCGVGETQVDQIFVSTSVAVSQWSDSSGVVGIFYSRSVCLSREFSAGKIFMEMAQGYEKTTGIVGGFKLTDQGFSYFIMGRMYTPGFIALRSSPLSEWSGSRKNERGLYQGLSLRWLNNKLTCYSDIYRQSEAPESLIHPLAGSETAWRWEWQKKGKRIRVQGKREIKSNEQADLYSSTKYRGQEIRDLYKFVYYRNINKKFRIKIQVSHTSFITDDDHSTGLGLEGLLRWQWANYKFEIDWVQTRVENYDSRLYFWDLNLPNEMRSRVYTATGYYPGFKLAIGTKQNYYIAGRIRWLIPFSPNKVKLDYEGGLLIEVNL